jgi:hypothetical protein
VDDNSGMDEKPAGRGGGRVLIALVAALVLLPLLYVLSVGPAAWLHGSGWLSGKGRSTLQAGYFPLKWTAQNVTVIGPVIANYANWCEGDRAVSLVPNPSS